MRSRFLGLLEQNYTLSSHNKKNLVYMQGMLHSNF